MWFYLRIGLTYLVVGFAVALIFHFILKKKTPGNFWGALIVGLVGSFLGGIVFQLIPDLFKALADFNYVNLYAAFAGAFVLVGVLVKLSSYK
jgi:uncharacterized membrane protein YeaQ/YmgE (transglycosylase-associated protein family)